MFGRLNLMTNSRFKWEVRISLFFAVVVAGLIFGSRMVPGLWLLTLPFSWPGIRFPEGTPVVDGPRPEWHFIRSLEIAILRDLVYRFLENTDKSK
jgi:hypothetical protein